MKLLIDCGNTRLKLCVTDTPLINQQSLFYLDYKQLHPDTWPIELQTLSYTEIWGVNVHQKSTKETLSEAIKQKFGQTPQWVTATENFLGLKNSYDEPSSLGADRWLALLAIWLMDKSDQTKLLVSFGTATTIDTLSTQGIFEGGCILPGWQMMLNSLHQGTAQLPLAHGAFTDFPHNTHQAIMNGIKQAQLGAVLRQAQISYKTWQKTLTLHIHGGASLSLKDELLKLQATFPWIEHIQFHDNLVLQGLSYVAHTSSQVKY